MLKKPALFCLLCWIQYSAAEVYAIRFDSQFYFEEFEDAPSTFGKKLSDGVVRAMLVKSEPSDGCTDQLKPPPANIENETGKWVVIMPRFTLQMNCTFEQKVRMGQLAGYDGVIIYNVHSDQLIPMYAKNSTGIYIPSVFVGESSGKLLAQVYTDPKYFIVITGETPFNIQTHLLIPFAIVVAICFLVMVLFLFVKWLKDRRRQRRHRLPKSALNKIPTCKYQKGDPYETCAVCLDDYIEGEKLRVLPCNHAYHTKCIDPWLTRNRRVCPICKRKVFAHDEPHHNDSDSDIDTDDTTPLINPNNRNVTQGGTFLQQQQEQSQNQTSDENENPVQRAARSISQQSGVVGVGIADFITASDHHSINGDYQSCTSTNSEHDPDCHEEVHIYPHRNRGEDGGGGGGSGRVNGSDTDSDVRV